MAHILLLEPDTALGQTYQQALEHQGHHVWLYQVAGDAIQALDSLQIDAIVLELQLTRHNGLEFLYELRSYADWQDIPVIIHSFVMPDKIQNALTFKELGVAECLYKPRTTLAQLTGTVDAITTK